jgi:hypothetical protein
VVGSIESDGGDPPFFSDAALWLEGSLTLLPKIGGGTWAGATAVNFKDDVVGYSETDIGRSDFQNGEIHAVLWRRQ